MDARRRHVVDVEELPLRRARAPDRHRRRMGELGLVEAADQGGDHVAVLGVVVVARAVEIGRHDAAIVDAILAVVALAELDPGDFRDRVGLVGGFESAGEQGVFPHRLPGELRVDARRAEEQQLLHAAAEGGVDDVGLDHQVFVDELGGIGVVGVDAADLGRREVNLVRALGEEELVNAPLVDQIEFRMGARDDAGGALCAQAAHDRRTDHAAMPGNVDFFWNAHAPVPWFKVCVWKRQVLSHISARPRFAVQPSSSRAFSVLA